MAHKLRHRSWSDEKNGKATALQCSTPAFLDQVNETKELCTCGTRIYFRPLEPCRHLCRGIPYFICLSIPYENLYFVNLPSCVCMCSAFRCAGTYSIRISVGRPRAWSNVHTDRSLISRTSASFYVRIWRVRTKTPCQRLYPLLTRQSPLVISSSAIKACGKEGRWEEALELLEEMEEDGIKPNLITYTGGDWPLSFRVPDIDRFSWLLG